MLRICVCVHLYFHLVQSGLLLCILKHYRANGWLKGNLLMENLKCTFIFPGYTLNETNNATVLCVN